MKNNQQPIIQLKDVFKSFLVIDQKIPVLKNITLNILSNEFTIIYGPSGSGKSTLLHVILGLEKPESGHVEVLGNQLYDKKNEDDLADFRKKCIGMIYQQAHWIKSMNVLENVTLPLTLLGISKEKRTEKAKEMLKVVGLQDWAFHNPAELSSGQQQKISFARALIANPDLIIADEPTGNLDYKSGIELIFLFKKLIETENKSLVMVTHDLEYLKYADRAIHFFDGQIKNTYKLKNNPKNIDQIYADQKKI